MREKMTSGMFEKAKLMVQLKNFVGRCEGIYIDVIWKSKGLSQILFKIVSVYEDGGVKILPSKTVASLMNRFYDDEADAIYYQAHGGDTEAVWYLRDQCHDIRRALSPVCQIVEAKTKKILTYDRYKEYRLEKEKKQQEENERERLRYIAEKNQAYLNSAQGYFQGTYMRYASA